MTSQERELVAAERIVDEALTGIRSLIEEALSANRYSVLGSLGRLADGLATLRVAGGQLANREMATGEGRSAQDAIDVMNAPSGTSPDAVPRRARTTRVRAEYPRFERQSERLVKIGWSKRDQAEYEHKAPRSAVDAVVSALAAREEGPFAIDELLPLHDSDGPDVPSYQAYMVIAWLRQLRAVDRMGNDGYVSRQEALSKDSIERAWKSLPAR